MAVNPYAAPSADLNAGVGVADAPLASRGARFGANLIDNLLVGAPWFVLSAALGSDGAAIGLLLGSLLSLGLGIYQIIRAARTGQTLGKKWLGIKVVKLDGSPVDFMSIIIMRGLVGQGILALLGPYFLIDALFIFRDDARCVHDLVAGTKVIQVQQ